MKIVQLITRPQRRGAEIFAVQLAEELLKLGHEVWVISIFKGNGGLSFSKGIIELGIEKKKKLDWNGFLKLAEELKKIEPEIIQANASDTLRYGVASKYFFWKPFKLIYRNANTISSFIKGKGQLIFNRFLHFHVDGVVSVSQHSRNDYQSLFNPKAIAAIPIGIDKEEIELKLQAGSFSFDKEYLLFIGSLVSEKDPIGMLHIFKEVLKSKPDLHLIFMGSGPLNQKLEREIERLGLLDFVTHIPNQENIFPILAKAKALVMPSKIEGLPGVILEAMYCEVPVVAYGVGGIPEILKNSVSGCCVIPGDFDSFQNSILDLLNCNEMELKNHIIKSKNMVMNKFQNMSLSEEFDKFYLRLI